MIEQTYNDIVTPELLKDNIDNNGHPGFLEDYKVLHCLIRKYKPQTFFEIGTCDGSGAMIIKNALGTDGVLYSLDLPTEKIDKSLRVNGGDRVGKNCRLPFVQLRGDSMEFDFSKYPCEGYFCDGNHTEKSVYHETIQMIKQNPKLIIYHDANILEVASGILIGFEFNEDYDLFRVSDTRIAYAVKNNL